jgi:predicted SAM-dependent methyltransferase
MTNLKKIKLHLGCGLLYKKGYINIDNNKKLPKVDLLHDLTKRFTFKDNSIDEILCINVMEHIPNPINLLREINRVLKPGGKSVFRVPLANTFTAYCDITHVNHFTPFSFLHEQIYYEYHFRKKRIFLTLPYFHSAKLGWTPIKFPWWCMYLNNFIEVFTGIEGELIK